MRVVAKKNCKGNAGALDFIFGTNQWDLHIYLAIVSNQDEMGMLIFYMLCTKKQKTKIKDIKTLP